LRFFPRRLPLKGSEFVLPSFFSPRWEIEMDLTVVAEIEGLPIPPPPSIFFFYTKAQAPRHLTDSLVLVTQSTPPISFPVFPAPPALFPRKSRSGIFFLSTDSCRPTFDFLSRQLIEPSAPPLKPLFSFSLGWTHGQLLRGRHFRYGPSPCVPLGRPVKSLLIIRQVVHPSPTYPLDVETPFLGDSGEWPRA